MIRFSAFENSTGAFFAALLTMLVPLASFAATADFRLDGGLRVRSDDKQWQATLGGRIHEDFAWYDTDITPLKDDSALRRARVALGLRYGEHLSAFVDYDFGNVAKGWKNLWVQYAFSDRYDIRAGNQSVPFGLGDYEGSNSSLLMEAPLPTQLAPGLATGGLFRGSGHSMAYSIGVFGKDVQYNDRRKLDGVSVTGRFTYTPLKERSNLLQLGASVEYRKANSGNTARFRARPESFVTNVRLIDTRTIDGVDDLLGLDLEFAWAPGPVLAEAEYVHTSVSRSAASDLVFSGWYATVGYLLTGEHHSYNRHTATFGKVEPDHRWGAVELAARYSTLDLSDADVLGGQQHNIAAGINWYLNPNCRLMLNYIWVDASPNRDGVNESPSIVQLRLQAGF